MKVPAWFKPFSRRIRLMVARAVVRLIDDAARLQLLQVELLAGETRDKVERFQEYGFTSHPVKGAEVIALAVGGNRDHVVVIAADDRRFRVRNLAEGEVALYTDEGDVIHFKRSQLIEINSGGHVKVVAPQCTIDSPSTRITGAVQIDGPVVCGDAVTANGQISSSTGVSIGQLELGTHVHGGVTAGTDSTGGPQ